MAAPKFARSADAKKAGWFSRRHQTNQPHLERQEDRRIKKDLKKSNALERKKDRESITPEQQLQKLDNELGIGVGAVKERSRLKKLIESKNG